LSWCRSRGQLLAPRSSHTRWWRPASILLRVSWLFLSMLVS